VRGRDRLLHDQQTVCFAAAVAAAVCELFYVHLIASVYGGKRQRTAKQTKTEMKIRPGEAFLSFINLAFIFYFLAATNTNFCFRMQSPIFQVSLFFYFFRFFIFRFSFFPRLY